MKDLFTWDVDESRKLVLRDDRHWYCLDAGEPEKLWSVASVAEMTMAAEIERLRNSISEAANKLSCVAVDRSCSDVPEIVRVCDNQALGILLEATQKARNP